MAGFVLLIFVGKCNHRQCAHAIMCQDSTFKVCGNREVRARVGALASSSRIFSVGDRPLTASKLATWSLQGDLSGAQMTIAAKSITKNSLQRIFRIATSLAFHRSHKGLSLENSQKSLKRGSRGLLAPGSKKLKKSRKKVENGPKTRKKLDK